MDKKRAAVIKRAVKGDAVLGVYSGLFTGNLPLNAKRLEINDRVELIRGYDVIVKTVLTGLTSTKGVDCLIMGGKGIILVSQMKVYLTTPLTADGVKFAKIDFSLTDLIKGSAADVYARNMSVSGVYHAVFEDMILKGYPVTMEMDTDYSGAIDNYNTAVPAWGNGEVVRNAANNQMGIECSRLTTENFGSVKNLCLFYKKGNAMFYDQLMIAYSSKSVTERKKCVELHVSEMTTGIDVVGFKAVLIGADGTQYSGTGNEKGKCIFNSLKTDVYVLVITRKGYVEKRILRIAYTKGKLLKMEEVMVLVDAVTIAETKKGDKGGNEGAENETNS